jgi:hypothetical protein
MCKFNENIVLTCGEFEPIYRDTDKVDISITIRENFNYNNQADVIVASDSFVIAGALNSLGYQPITPKMLSGGRNKNIKTAYVIGNRVYAFGQDDKNWLMTLIDTTSNG